MEFSFAGQIWFWRGPSPFHFVSMPQDASEAIAAMGPAISYGWGAITVVCRSGDVEWKTAIFPKDGVYLVPIKDTVRKALDVDVDDEIAIELEILER